MQNNYPTFVWNKYNWVAQITLPSWVGFQNKPGFHGCLTPDTADCTCQIVFAPEGRGDRPLTGQEHSLVSWFIRHEPSLQQPLLAALLNTYPELQDYQGYTDDEKLEFMPDVTSAMGFQPLIGLQDIFIHPVTKDGMPYVGFGFGCTWDEEHGLGILMHGTRVVEIGGADTAYLLWVAEPAIPGQPVTRT